MAGVTTAGHSGVVRMLELLEDEITRTLSLLGVRTWAEFDRSCLHGAQPVVPPHVLSTFPLLKIDDY